MDDLRQRLERLNRAQRQELAARLNAHRSARLLAFVTLAKGAEVPDPERLRRELVDVLPAHLVPAAVTIVDEFPRLPNGKLDRGRLPRPDRRQDRSQPTIVHDEIQERLVDIWREVLDCEEILATDDFFEIGGDSISSIRLISRMRSEGFEISPAEFFEHPRIIDLVSRFRDGADLPVRERVRSYWQSLLGRAIGDDDKFYEVGGDASLEVHLLNWIHGEFGVTVPMERFYETPTVAGVTDLLTGAAAAGDWKGGLLPIRPAAGGRSLYVVHGLFGGIGWARDLIRHIDPSITLSGLQSRLKDDGTPRHTRLEDMAAEHVTELLNHHSDGEVNLIGWCGGGMVAYEMAQQLRAQGRAVGNLILIETVALDGLARLSTWKRLLYWTFGWHRRLRNRLGKNAVGREEIDELAREAGGYDPDGPVTNLRRTNNEAYLNYRPQTFAGDLHLFRCSSSLAAGIYAEKTLGWKPLVDGRLIVHELAGDHKTIFSEPFVRQLANEINRLF